MKFIIVSLLVVAACADLHPINHDLYSQIKKTATTWTPMNPEDNPFAYMPIEQIRAMMGTKLMVVEHTATDLGFTPRESFDSREEWPDKIHAIRDQGQCGSCWAFGATEALSDRLAIRGTVNTVLSPQHLVSCDMGNFGCQGGYLGETWSYMNAHGVMTEECYKYHSGDDGDDGKCQTTCDDGSKGELYFSGEPAFSTENTRTMQEIEKNGPVEAAFMVYEDFLHYGGGIYKHGSGDFLGGHAIKCIGWGTDPDAGDYWIMANSWGEGWGEKGFFRIVKGDCDVDSQMTFDHVEETASF